MTADPRTFRYDHDGLRLGGRIHGDLGERPLPFVCLPGLTRNARDFDAFARIVRSGSNARPVVAFDYRGRGESEWAKDASTYTLPHEMADVVEGLRQLGIGRAVFVGTSRGALMLHLMGIDHQEAIAGAVLNDAGPKLEIAGLLAIKAYVGRTGRLPNWAAAIDVVRGINAPTFPALRTDDFERMARAHFRQTSEGVVADYDPRLADALAGIEPGAALPELWDGFTALARAPLMVIRGEHSALLSRETVMRMKSVDPRLQVVEAGGQGHAPLLETPEVAEKVVAFAAAIDPALPGQNPIGAD